MTDWPSDQEWITTEMDFKAVMMAYISGTDVHYNGNALNDPDYIPVSKYVSCKEILWDHYEHGTSYRIKNPNYQPIEPDPEPEVEIPDGWVVCESHEAQFGFNKNHWHNGLACILIPENYTVFIKPAPGFEKCDAEWWFKRADESCSIARDDDFVWNEFDTCSPGLYKSSGFFTGNGRHLWPSECPEFDGPWEESLMINPLKALGE